jgi:hypothetical protein
MIAKKEEDKVVLNQEAIQICPVCEERSVVVWYGEIAQLTKMFCLECGRFWIEVEGVMREDRMEYTDWMTRQLEKYKKIIRNRPVTGLHFQDSGEYGWLGEEKEDTYGKHIDEKNKQLDKEVEWIVEGAISKVIMASLASGVPCDPDTSDGINYIESCLDKMKKEMEESEDI